MCGVIFVANDKEEIQHQLDFYLNIMKSHVLNELMLKMCLPTSTHARSPY